MRLTYPHAGAKCKRIVVLIGAAALLWASAASAWALGEKQHVFPTAQPGAFALVQSGAAAPLYVDPLDWPGVMLAASSFESDVASVTGVKPVTVHGLRQDATLVVIGTIGHSSLIDQLIASHKLDVSSIRGHWEMSVTQVIEHPFSGVRRALVIAGADKRGTIFGIYDLSEQIGVSPWAWWADVPVRHSDNLFVADGRYIQMEPAVKYRGIFLNDEAPALSGWAQEKFGGFNHKFYVHVFELLLRLKANLLWPAMWGSAFNEDDPLNPKLADEYGIVMGTSHHEPMMRAQQEWKRHGKGPWNYATNSNELDAFWRYGVRRNRNYENLVTIGMRGDGDEAMSASTNTALLERIVAAQRKILAEEVNPDLSKVPQVWALYKEVQDYYEKGMRVPDDVTLLWCDDNWGNIRRLPTAEERNRSGGAGIYYHFDYVGDPRSYKWLNTYNITKVWEQMNLAVHYGAVREWIVNVGDLKPMEFPIEFFLSMARTPDRWGKDNLQEFTRLWAAREFGPEHADEIAELMSAYTKYNSRRKPEQLTPATYSLTEDHEADRVDSDWRNLTARAEHVNAELPENERPAFFELVLYPLKASAVVGEMYIAAGRNRLYAREGRASANFYADETRRLFAEDAELTDEYNHKLLHGKWDHMMDQTHIGYMYWNEPPLNAMPAVQQVQPLSGAKMVIFPEGPIAESGEPVQEALPEFDAENRQVRSIDIANRGSQPFHFSATASEPWITLSTTGGNVTLDRQVEVNIDWAKTPLGDSSGWITFVQDGATGIAPVKVLVHAFRPSPAASIKGFVENDGIVSIQAEHTTVNRMVDGVSWQKIPGFGETLSGMEAFPVTAPSTTNHANQACMDYSFYLYHAGDSTLRSFLAPTMSFAPGRGLRYSIALDDRPPVMVNAWASDTQADWAKAVSDGVHGISTALSNVSAGQHVLQFCRVDAGVVLERLTISQGEPSATYLGSPESAYIGTRGTETTHGEIKQPAMPSLPQ